MQGEIATILGEDIKDMTKIKKERDTWILVCLPSPGYIFFQVKYFCRDWIGPTRTIYFSSRSLAFYAVPRTWETKLVVSNWRTLNKVSILQAFVAYIELDSSVWVQKEEKRTFH
jgi:hypothetical protein